LDSEMSRCDSGVFRLLRQFICKCRWPQTKVLTKVISVRRIKPILAATVVSIGLFAGGCANNAELLDGLEEISSQIGQSGGALTTADISNGLKQALSISSQQVVQQLGQTGGYNLDPKIHIPLPRALVNAREVASKVGLAGSFDSLETRLNQAAEQAAPKARSLFLNAISQMTLSDARGILQGPDDAATQFFKRTTGQPLSDAMRPIIDNSLSKVGAVRSFNQLLASYRQIPFAPPVEADLTAHVLEKGMSGIWYYIAQEEQAIRQNPLKRTTELLKRVFGSAG